MKIACYEFVDPNTLKVIAFDDDVAQGILVAARCCDTIKSGSLVNGVLLYGEPAVLKFKTEYSGDYEDVVNDLARVLKRMDTYLFSTEILVNNIV